MHATFIRLSCILLAIGCLLGGASAETAADATVSTVAFQGVDSLFTLNDNPDPTDRLHLRVKPDRAAESLGKFNNRTPVEVLSQQGDWSHVVIGTDGRLDGWMLTKYLAFGEAMDGVACASPIKALREEHRGCALFARADRKQATGVAYASGNDKWIAGVISDEWYVLLDAEGDTGYLPQSWMWNGND